MSKKVNPATGSEVRAWARENLSAIPEAGHKCLGGNARGRLHPSVVEAFESATGQKYVVGSSIPQITVKVPATDKAGRNISRKVTVPMSEYRTLAGARAAGRVSAEGHAAAVAALAARSGQ